MNRKLTLSIEQQVIELAKTYARKQGRSLSDIVETYLRAVTGKQTPDSDIPSSPIVDSLVGVIPDDGTDYKEARYERLKEKYLKDE